ncbi:MAG: RnfABCDGE type electron transport complex subunit G [Cyclobacteriaceae bacterium]|nr:RnfABCDGE type electron transport complex subunit G [Cyclobacteriaceae bacterium]
MAQKESTLFNMISSLVVVTLIASTALGYVYELTKGPIAEAKLAKKLKAIDEVVLEYNNKPVEEMYKIPIEGSADSLEVYPAKKEGKLVASAIRTYSPKGYGGNVWLMVGMLPDGSIHNISVLEHHETPGLGTKMADDAFKNQFLGKNPASFDLSVKKDGGNIDALSGATISSRAFGHAAQLAFDTYMKGGKHE